MAPSTVVVSGPDAALDPPIKTIWFEGVPRLFAGGLPVTPVNLALRDRVSHGATRVSIRSYAYAVSLFLSFLVSRRRSLVGASNADFTAFTAALLGQVYRDGDGQETRLPGKRSPGTAQSIVSHLYGLFVDIEAAYNVHFDWRGFRPASYNARGRGDVRIHRFRVPLRSPLALPDEQFGHLLERAVELWADEIPTGDVAFAADPASQRGALLARNAGILMLLRYAGARRAEVPPLDLEDIDRAEGVIRLVTKGRHGAKEPVVLLPIVEHSLMRYIMSFRPYGLRPFRRHSRQQPRAVDRHAVLLGHSPHRYGERISEETVRGVIDRLRPALDPPWRERLHPHLLRHSFAHELQRTTGSFAASANLRHRALSSIDAYRGDAQQWADALGELNDTATAQFERAGIGGAL